MSLTKQDFQRVGMLAILSQFATNPNIDVSTRLSIKQSLLIVLNDHPVNDEVEKKVRELLK